MSVRSDRPSALAAAWQAIVAGPSSGPAAWTPAEVAASRCTNAYLRLLQVLARLEAACVLAVAEAHLLREAADARFFGDPDAERWLVLAEVAFELVSERGEVDPVEVSALRERLSDIATPFRPPGACA